MSYETGPKPFNHDESRGKWSNPKDFLYACVGNAFKADTILFMPPLIFSQLGFYAIIPYLLILAVCVVPIIFIQSFLGQFSGTGFISVFRIAPLFKGVGYVSLALNLITLAYYSVFSVIPLMSLFHIMQPTIPWSCEGAKEWMIRENDTISPCDYPNRTSEEDYQFRVQLPSVDFFTSNINFTEYLLEPGFSWMMLPCTFLVWRSVACIVVKPIETIGRLVRYACCAVIVIMCFLLFRFLFLAGAMKGLKQFFQPSNSLAPESWFMLPFIILSTLGPGWGSFITMASFNDFKTDIFRFSWKVSLVQLGIVLGVTFLSLLMSGFVFTPFGGEVDKYIFANYYNQFLIIPTGLTLMEVPHFWTFLFFVMLLLGSLTLLVVQLISVLTTLFDEYEALRSRKRNFTLAIATVLGISSAFFCSSHGLGLLALLTKSTFITQMILNLLLILVVLWVYGRERFQRDIMFMNSRVYSKLKVNLVRFVAPLFLILGILGALLLTANHVFAHFSSVMVLLMAALTVIPWCLLPGYCIYKIMRTSGKFSSRMKRCVRPTDWYPADPTYKQSYEETISNPEMSHQLTNPLEGEAKEFLNSTDTA